MAFSNLVPADWTEARHDHGSILPLPIRKRLGDGLAPFSEERRFHNLCGFCSACCTGKSSPQKSMPLLCCCLFALCCGMPMALLRYLWKYDEKPRNLPAQPIVAEAVPEERKIASKVRTFPSFAKLYRVRACYGHGGSKKMRNLNDLS